MQASTSYDRIPSNGDISRLSDEMREMANGMADLRKRLEKVESDQTVLEESHSQLAKDTSEYKDSTNSKIDDIYDRLNNLNIPTLPPMNLTNSSGELDTNAIMIALENLRKEVHSQFVTRPVFE